MRRLLFNHADAWIVTLVIVLMALLIHDSVSASTLYLLVGITAGYWLAFAANDYYDAPFDAQEPVKAQRNFFVVHPVPKRAIVIVVGIMGVLLMPAFAQFGRMGYAIVAISLFFMWAYSADPLRLKNRPGLDLATHAIFVETFPYIATLLLIGATWQKIDYIIIFCAILASLTAQLEQQIRDYDIDARTGGTFTTRFGIRSSAHLLRGATILLIVTVSYFILDGTVPLIFLPVALIPLPALLHRLVREPGQPRSQRYVQIAVTMGAVYVAALFIYIVIP
jgi:4-hydroxybenzoate polyprenyltransferase